VKVVAAPAERGSFLALAVVLGAFTMVALAVLGGYPILEVAPLIGIGLAVAVWHQTILAWPALLSALVIVVLFIPIRRYVMPGSLPFELEPYRVLVAFLIAGWLASLLADPRVRIRRTPFDGPVVAIAFATLASISLNGGRIHELGVGDIVGKKVTFLASVLLAFFLIASVVRDRTSIDRLLKVLVGGAAVVAGFALIEYRTGFNIFNELSRVVPLLELRDVLSEDDVARGGRNRVYASAQHPIALGALLVMVLPLALYLGRSSGRRWWLAGAVIAMGALGTLSRTGILMLLVIVCIFLWLRPRETKRFWPALLPALVVVHLALPGTIGTLKASFFPEGGLIQEQSASAGGRGSGRIADLGPSLAEWSRQPVLGQGFGTRVVDEGPKNNALILDNQWLVTLLETGLVGTVAWGWLLLRAVRRLGRAAKEDLGERGWLAAALAASFAAFAAGLFTYDGFSFIQVTFVTFILLGVAGALLTPATARRWALARGGLR
jgi:polysaccharide biosynthesis protein PslJ